MRDEDRRDFRALYNEQTLAEVHGNYSAVSRPLLVARLWYYSRIWFYKLESHRSGELWMNGHDGRRIVVTNVFPSDISFSWRVITMNCESFMDFLLVQPVFM